MAFLIWRYLHRRLLSTLRYSKSLKTTDGCHHTGPWQTRCITSTNRRAAGSIHAALNLLELKDRKSRPQYWKRMEEVRFLPGNDSFKAYLTREWEISPNRLLSCDLCHWLIVCLNQISNTMSYTALELWIRDLPHRFGRASRTSDTNQIKSQCRRRSVLFFPNRLTCRSAPS